MHWLLLCTNQVSNKYSNIQKQNRYQFNYIDEVIHEALQ